MSIHDNADEYLQARDEAFRKLDMEFAKQMIPNCSDRYTLLLAMHKARYECTTIEAHYRHESYRWLRDHGFKRMNGLPLLPEGELPV